MMRVKKWMAGIMAAIMTAGVLAGCGGSGQEPAAAESGSAQETGSTEEAGGGDSTADTAQVSEGPTYNGQDVSEPVELVMYYIGDKPEDEEKVLEEINKILQEKINATLVLKNLSMSDYSTKYSLTLAGGEDVDMIYTSTWAFYQSEANKGAFAEVTDQVRSDYMPLTMENQAEASWGQARINGKVYFVPGNMANVSMNAFLIRGDLREKYGLEPLDSVEDLEAYYTAVANDPDSGVQFPYAASQNNTEGRYAMFFAGNDLVRIDGSIADYITYKYSEDFTADDLVWIYDTQEYAEYAETAAEYRELHRHIVKKFQDTFFDRNGMMTVQTQTAHIVALYFNLTPEPWIGKTLTGLKRLLDKENGHLVTGFVGTPYFCHALSQNGAVEEAYALLLKEDFPSWLYQVKMGATTIWEHWDGIRPDGSMWSADMNSFNHYAYGAIGEWMYRVMAGLETDERNPGFKRAVFYPRIGGGLAWVEGTYHSVYGKEGVRWEAEANRITLTVTVPANTTAVVRLDRAKEVLVSDGLDFFPGNNYMEAEAGSGVYRIVFVR